MVDHSFCVLSVSEFTLTFSIPILLFPSETALFLAVAWEMLLLVVLNFYIARIKKENPIKLVSEHILLAIFVIVVSHFVGNLVAMAFE